MEVGSRKRTWRGGLAAVLAFLGAGNAPAAGAPRASGAAGEREADPARREAEVGRLARLDTEEGWRAVAAALADEEGRVAERAQLELGRARSAGALSVLLGREGLGSRDQRVAARAAEALGRSPQGLTPEPLLDALGRSDRELRARVCHALEQALREGRLEGAGDERVRRRLLAKLSGLARGERERDERTRARAMACVLELDPRAALELLERAARERSRPYLRAAACALAPRLAGSPEAEEILLAGCEDPWWGVRARAIDGLASLLPGNERAAELGGALLARLEGDPRPSNRRRALEALRRASGRAHGEDPRPWRAWLEAGAPPSPAAPARATAEGERTLALEQVRIRSDHVAFLVDLSGSMWMARDGGLSRKAVADRRFGELLAALPEETRFLLVPYTREPHPWREELERASRRDVAEARRFFEELDERGAGDLWEAALWALGHEEVDTLVVLTDGVPTGGEVNRMELVTRLFEERLLGHPVIVDALLVDPGEGARRRWSELCEATGGRSLPVALRLGPEEDGGGE